MLGETGTGKNDWNWEKLSKVISKISLAVVVLLTLLVVAGSCIFYRLFVYPAGSIPAEQKLPAVTEQQLEPTELEMVQDLLGPWHSASSTIPEYPEYYANILLLKEDGTAFRSTSRMQVDTDSDSWSKINPPEISEMTVYGQIVELRINRNEFYVWANQPFILEQTPMVLYAVDLSGKMNMIGVDNATKAGYFYK